MVEYFYMEDNISPLSRDQVVALNDEVERVLLNEATENGVSAAYEAEVRTLLVMTQWDLIDDLIGLGVTLPNLRKINTELTHYRAELVHEYTLLKNRSVEALTEDAITIVKLDLVEQLAHVVVYELDSSSLPADRKDIQVNIADSQVLSEDDKKAFLTVISARFDR